MKLTAFYSESQINHIEQILVEMLTVNQPVKFPACYGTKMCIVKFTQA